LNQTGVKTKPVLITATSSNPYLAGSSVVCPLSVMLDELKATCLQSFLVQVTVNVSDPRVKESVKLVDPVNEVKLKLFSVKKLRFVLLVLGNAEPILGAKLIFTVRHHSGWKRGRFTDLSAHSQPQVHWWVLTGSGWSRYQF
jgi:hypothetical protein